MSSRWPTHVGRIVTGAAVSLVVAGPWSAPLAFAHSEPIETSPAPGSVLDELPDEVVIRFSEELADGSTIEVLGPDGGRADLGGTATDLADLQRVTLRVALAPQGDQEGDFTVRWVATSAADGDRTDGEYVFGVGPGADLRSTSPAGEARRSRWLAPGLMIAAALLAAVLFVPGPRRRQPDKAGL